MIESILKRKGISFKAKVAIKSAISLFSVVLAVVLPQIVHIVAGSKGGVTWLPMYLPVLIGGCLLGMRCGLAVGILSPLCSFLLTSLTGTPMPAPVRLPYMMAELSVMAAVCGLFSKKINVNALWSFVAIAVAFVSGRGAFMVFATVFSVVSPLSATIVWSQIVSGIWGVLVQTILLPLVIILLSVLLKRKKD